MYSKWRHSHQRQALPIERLCHGPPHLVEYPELHFALDEREEHAELRAPNELEEATEDVVVVQEVLSSLPDVLIERSLQVHEHVVKLN